MFWRSRRTWSLDAKPEMKLGLYTAILVQKFFKDSFSKVLGKTTQTNTLRVLWCGGPWRPTTEEAQACNISQKKPPATPVICARHTEENTAWSRLNDRDLGRREDPKTCLSLSHDCRRSRSKTLNKVLKTNKKQKEKTTTQPQKPTENQGKKSRLTDLLLLTTSSRAS